MRDLYRYAVMKIFEEASHIALNLQSQGCLDLNDCITTRADGVVVLSEDYSPYMRKSEWNAYGAKGDEVIDMLNINNFHDSLLAILNRAKELDAPADKISRLLAEEQCVYEIGSVLYQSLSDRAKANYEDVIDNIQNNNRVAESAEMVVNKDLRNISDAMLLSSGTVVATYTAPKMGINLALRVAGDVNLTYKGQVYRDVSEFPDELKALMTYDNKFRQHPDVNVLNNSWFELVQTDNNGNIIEAEVADPENYTEDEIKALFDDKVSEIILSRFKDAEANIDIERPDFDRE